MSGYTPEQSRQLLKQVHANQPGPYYYMTHSKIPENGEPPADFMEQLNKVRIIQVKNGPRFANVVALYRQFKRDFPDTGRVAIWVSAGDPESKDSPVLMLDSSWVSKALFK